MPSVGAESEVAALREAIGPLLRDGLVTAKRLYQFTGLDWPVSAETYIEKMAAHWQRHAAPWRQLLADEHIAMVERVLDRSTLKTWWDPDQTV